MDHGKFSGDPCTRWLTEVGDDRNMEILEDFTFTDPAATVWSAPAHSVVNGASIPRPLWSVVGSPYTGDYRRASIVHDVACGLAGGDDVKRRAADRMFYHACRTGGCSVREATILYLGVRIGAAWSVVPQWAPAAVAGGRGPRVQRFVTEARVEFDFQHAAEMVLAQGEVDDPFEIERRADAALTTVTGLDSIQAP
jgi:hypothetical protein